MPDAVNQYFIERINGLRIGLGLNPLAPQAQLQTAAQGHADWMAQTGTFSHTGRDGSTQGQRTSAAGYQFASGENIGLGMIIPSRSIQVLVDDMVDGFAASPSHYANLTRSTFKAIGAATAIATSSDPDQFYVVHNFGTANFADTITYLTGVFYADADRDGGYDIGEAVAGTVKVFNGTTLVGETATLSGGGWSLVVAAGSYRVELSSGGRTVSHDVTVGNRNIKLDFAGLSPDELLIRHSSGALLSWDTTRGGGGFTNHLDLGTTTVAGVADFTGDGKADVLFRLADGGHVAWDIGKGGAGFTGLPTFGEYQLVRTGNFLGSGADDLLLQKQATGELIFLDVAGGNAVTPFLTLGSGFKVLGAGQMNGAGTTDIVFQNTASGALLYWHGSGFSDLLTLAPDSGWQVAGIGDFTGTATDDMLLFNTGSRAFLFWDQSRGANGFQDFVTLQAGWTMAGIADLNGDGRDDVMLQETATGHTLFWNGTRFEDLGTVLAGVQLVGLGDVG